MVASIHVFCKFNVIVALTVSVRTSAVVGIPRPRHTRESSHQLQQPDDLAGSYLVQCGTRQCDLRQQYCDTVINTCARCDDDCHPGRINGNRPATEECRKNCAGEFASILAVISDHYDR